MKGSAPRITCLAAQFFRSEIVKHGWQLHVLYGHSILWPLRWFLRPWTLQLAQSGLRPFRDLRGSASRSNAIVDISITKSVIYLLQYFQCRLVRLVLSGLLWSCRVDAVGLWACSLCCTPFRGPLFCKDIYAGVLFLFSHDWDSVDTILRLWLLDEARLDSPCSRSCFWLCSCSRKLETLGHSSIMGC